MSIKQDWWSMGDEYGYVTFVAVERLDGTG